MKGKSYSSTINFLYQENYEKAPRDFQAMSNFDDFDQYKPFLYLSLISNSNKDLESIKVSVSV